jgi:serine protease Do
MLAVALVMLLTPQTSVQASAGEDAGIEQVAPPTSDDAAENDDELAVDNLEDARKAIVQIVAVGAFVEPGEEMSTGAGSGTGFIIDPAGVAVTNNHVVTGGALYKVYVEGAKKPVNARVLGVDECADLAIIDLQGDGYSYLRWREDPVKVGLDVYAAGFPLGDPEYTMTRGIISKEHADGETNWASVDGVLEHDATINPGNSGGPLLDEDGRVVGINYRRNDAGQFFAIAADEALPIIEQLRTGADIDAIGINSEAVTVGEDLTGVWISSVQSGSTADAVGLKPGDIILSLENIPLATDGTMSTYCDILRSHDPGDTLTIEVLRFDTDEVLKGQLNGRALEQSFTLDNGEEAPGENAQTGDGSAADPTPAYEEYQTISDEQGILSVEVPTAWGDVQEEPWQIDDQTVGVKLYASPDLEAFFSDWGVPGLIMSYSDVLAGTIDQGAYLDSVDYTENCEAVERSELTEGFYTGPYDVWTGCGDAGASVWILELTPETNDYLLAIEIYAASDADLAARDRILDSFVVTPPGQAQEEPDVTDITGDEGQGEGDFLNSYVTVENDAISALIPEEWNDDRLEDWIVDEEKVGFTYTASTDLDSYENGWTTPGFTVYTNLDPVDGYDPVGALDDLDFSDNCTYEDRQTHTHSINGIDYTGAYDIWNDCGGEDNFMVALSAMSNPPDHAVFLFAQGVSDADVEAFNVLAETFYVETPGTKPLIEANQQQNQQEEQQAQQEYAPFTDETEAFSVLLPTEWTDSENDDWVIDGDTVGRTLTAAPDLADFEDSWDVPGIFIGVSDVLPAVLDADEILDAFEFSDECEYDDRYPYEGETLIGSYDIWGACGGLENQSLVVLAGVAKEDESKGALVVISLPDSSNLPLFDTILNSINLTGEASASASGTAANQGQTPTATVMVKALNLRNGPGTNYRRVGALNQGDELQVQGQVNDCAWLFVVAPDGQNGWVSGAAQYVTLNAACDAIPETPAPASASGGSSAGGSGSASASQGCYLFQNQLGAELTITFTRQGDGWNTSFKIAPSAEKEQCFDPGKYTYTLDAPPPWGSTNGELEVAKGDYYLFPISPE